MPTEIRRYRQILGISQIRLARLARVSCFRYKQFELGNQRLADEETKSVCEALRKERDRLAGELKEATVGAGLE